jgi:hypothetical protein
MCVDDRLTGPLAFHLQLQPIVFLPELGSGSLHHFLRKVPHCQYNVDLPHISTPSWAKVWEMEDMMTRLVDICIFMVKVSSQADE